MSKRSSPDEPSDLAAVSQDEASSQEDGISQEDGMSNPSSDPVSSDPVYHSVWDKRCLCQFQLMIAILLHFLPRVKETFLPSLMIFSK